MQTTRIFVTSEDNALVSCPYCSKQVMAKVGKFKGKGKPLKIRCDCKKEFSVFLEFRKGVRKPNFSRGRYCKKDKGGEEGRIRVRDVSMHGLHFTTWNSHTLKEGDPIHVYCILDDKKGVEIDRDAIVRWVKEDAVGCEFTGNVQFDADLGFYLRD